jgi:hypothetical protein
VIEDSRLVNLFFDEVTPLIHDNSMDNLKLTGKNNEMVLNTRLQ